MVTLIGSTITWFVGEPLEAVPASPGLQHPVRRRVAARAFAQAAGCQTSNHQEPSSCCSIACHRAAEAQRLVDRLLDQRTARRLLHHRRGDVARGDDAVLRRGRGVHHERLVEPVMSSLLGLARPGRGSSRPATSAASSLCVDWVAKIIACGERAGTAPTRSRGSRRRTRGSWRRLPGLVEVQHVDRVAERLLDRRRRCSRARRRSSWS